MRILFVTWDGPQVSYLEGLFLPIFRKLADAGHHVDVLQFGWGDQEQVETIAGVCQAHGVGYRPARVWRRLGGASAFASAVRGGALVRRALADFQSDVLMPRSLMPALSALVARTGPSVPLLFDADGLAADERVDFAGLSARSATYRALVAIEAEAVRKACAVLVRSQASVGILLERAGAGVRPDRFFKVLNGRDPDIFHPGDTETRAEVRARLGLAGDAPLLVYAGSVGPQYRMEKVAALFAAVRRLRPEAHLLLLSGSPADAQDALAAYDGSIASNSTILRASPDEVPSYLAAADLGIAYRTPSFSMRAVAPIKLSEYLLCGLPIAGTAAVGDTASAVQAGLFMDEEAGPNNAAEWLIQQVLPFREAIRSRARDVGRRYFSLDQSVASYLAALEHCSGSARTNQL